MDTRMFCAGMAKCQKHDEACACASTRGIVKPTVTALSAGQDICQTGARNHFHSSNATTNAC
eukprot:1154828-Pelagomonas_calceolata.AAC.3